MKQNVTIVLRDDPNDYGPPEAWVFDANSPGLISKMVERISARDQCEWIVKTLPMLIDDDA